MGIGNWYRSNLQLTIYFSRYITLTHAPEIIDSVYDIQLLLVDINHTKIDLQNGDNLLDIGNCYKSNLQWEIYFSKCLSPLHMHLNLLIQFTTYDSSRSISVCTKIDLRDDRYCIVRHLKPVGYESLTILLHKWKYHEAI